VNKYIRLIRPNQTGTLLIYATAVFGLCVGGIETGKVPNVWLFLQFLLGAFFMRTAGCIVNDIFDRNFDSKVERTKNRPIATREISVKTGLIISCFLTLFSLLILISLPERTYIFFISAGVLIFIYPTFKRFTYFPQVALGMAMAVGFLASFYTVSNEFTLKIILPFVVIIVWTIIYDTIYAMQDLKDDIKIGLKSTSIKFGKNYKQILYLLGILYLLLMLIFWQLSSLKFIIFPVLSFALLMLLIQKSGSENYGKMFKLTPIPCFLLSVGILFNML
jgi:4-hydroxybenzoate polyprenyltransferase